MDRVGVSIKEKAYCSRCGRSYTDPESVELVKKWQKEGYSPCPIISCPGEMKITLDIKEV